MENEANVVEAAWPWEMGAEMGLKPRVLGLSSSSTERSETKLFLSLGLCLSDFKFKDWDDL